MSFSVLMSLYSKEEPNSFRQSLESVFNQTLIPDEVVLVEDGPLTEDLYSIIREYKRSYPQLITVTLEKNGGLGNALNIGMENCSHELVARMDTDDICISNRFEKQIAYMNANPEIAVCGGQILEFIDDENNIVAHRFVPLTPEDCRRYYRDRDPLNHMTVMLKKSAVMSVGNYQPWHLDEDTYLWGRLLKAGYKIANLSDILVNVRVGKDMYARRGGWKYFKSDSKILKWKLENNLTTKSRYFYNYLVRFIVQVLMPNSFRAFIFKRLLRSNK